MVFAIGDACIVSIDFLEIVIGLYVLNGLQKDIEIKIQPFGPVCLRGTIQKRKFGMIANKVVDSPGKFDHVIDPTSGLFPT